MCFNAFTLFVVVSILLTFAEYVNVVFAPLFLTVPQHFSLQWRILVMLKSQTKLPELQA